MTMKIQSGNFETPLKPISQISLTLNPCPWFRSIHNGISNYHSIQNAHFAGLGNQSAYSSSTGDYQDFMRHYFSYPQAMFKLFNNTPQQVSQVFPYPLHLLQEIHLFLALHFGTIPMKICNQYPMCSQRYGNCRFPHINIHGGKYPVMEQIQSESTASQLAAPGIPWHSSPDLKRRTIGALSINPADTLAIAEIAQKKENFGN